MIAKKQQQDNDKNDPNKSGCSTWTKQKLFIALHRQSNVWSATSSSDQMISFLVSTSSSTSYVYHSTSRKSGIKVQVHNVYIWFMWLVNNLIQRRKQRYALDMIELSRQGKQWRWTTRLDTSDHARDRLRYISMQIFQSSTKRKVVQKIISGLQRSSDWDMERQTDRWDDT